MTTLLSATGMDVNSPNYLKRQIIPDANFLFLDLKKIIISLILRYYLDGLTFWRRAEGRVSNYYYN